MPRKLKQLPFKKQIDYMMDSLELGRLTRQFASENHNCRTINESNDTDLYHGSDFQNPFMREVKIT